jgi:hypothetical protein
MRLFSPLTEFNSIEFGIDIRLKTLNIFFILKKLLLTRYRGASVYTQMLKKKKFVFIK